MKEVLARVEQRKQEFAQLPLFEFLQDSTIDPRQRLAWAPCLAPFAMSFGDLNKYVLRKEPATNKIQQIINKHTYEDDHHWQWFLEDLEKLEFNPHLKLSEALRFVWGEDTKKTRQICNQIALHIFKADPVVVLAAVEAIEATGNVVLELTAQVAQEIQKSTKKKYRYFGEFHFVVETGHTTGTDDVEQFIESIQLTEETRQQAFEIVDTVFEVFTESIEELMEFVNKCSYHKLLRTA